MNAKDQLRLTSAPFGGTLAGLRQIALHMHRATPDGLLDKDDMAERHIDAVPRELDVLVLTCGIPDPAHDIAVPHRKIRPEEFAEMIAQTRARILEDTEGDVEREIAHDLEVAVYGDTILVKGGSDD